MELRGKQKRYLRAQAHHLTPIFQVGKNGVNEDMLKQIDEALVKRELFKVTLLQNASQTPAEVAEIFEEKLQCQVVQVIGKVLVLFRTSPKEKYQKVSKEVKAL